MKQAIAIAEREIVARRDLLLLAAAVMLIAVLMPLVPGTSNYDPASTRSVTSQALGLLLGCGIAAGLGISIFGRDLSSGRLGFFLARPVSAGAVWFGRMAAAIVIVLACELIVLIPALVTQWGRLITINAQGWWALVGGFVFVPIFLLFFVHAVTIMGDARSAWLFVDLIGLIGVALGIWLALRPLYLLGASIAVLAVGGATALAILVALVVAGWVGLAVGRTDPYRTHAALSTTLWLLLAVVAVASLSGSRWLGDFGPEEMDDLDVWSVAPNGSWIEVWGGAPWHLDVRRRALVSTIDQRHVMLPAYWHAYMMEAMYSADGSTAIGFDDVRSQEDTKALWRVDLGAESPEIVNTTFIVKQRTAVEVSSDGTRVAFLESGTLSVHELESEQLLAAFRLPTPFAGATMVFLENDRLRVYARSGDDSDITIRIGEFRVAENRFEETGRIEDLLGPMWMALSPSGEHMIVGLPSSEVGERIRVLYDAVDGTRIREIGRRGASRFLADGRVFSILRSPEGSHVIVESVDGLSRTEHDLRRADWEGLGGEALPGKMIVMRLDALEDRVDGRICELVDVDSGETRTLGAGIRENHDGYRWIRGGRLMVRWYKSTPEASRIFTDRTGAVVQWDPETGEMVHIVGGRRD